MNPPKCCPIDGHEMREIFRHKVLGRHDVSYLHCGGCGLVQTEDPYWLGEAYQSIITDLDTWIAIRSVYNARRLGPILSLLFPRDAVFVDAACGYGLLTRLMRDAGYRFYGHDKYCANLFAGHFQPPPGTRASAVCAFEVLEHIPNPVEFIAEQFETYGTDTVIASTTLFEGSPPDVSWPYYVFESGQHITFYEPRSLRAAAARLGCRYHRLMTDLHMLTRRAIPAWKRFLLTTPRVRGLYAWAAQFAPVRPGLTQSDHEDLRRRVQSTGG